ncbi:MAG: YkgJ family cysteine cluster protein [Clostridiales bacterium]|nr:YkgJ family cysteine cluster protein [Clostridiales bacterium]
MKRQVTLEEISDGKLYDCNDMVKADCNGCKGCSACCRGMGNSILLDPLDVYRLTKELGQDFEALLRDRVELNAVDGIILPNLKMTGEEERCFFLNEEGRCSIHAARPGICRIFPLGRHYENHSFRYFLQVHECRQEPKTKVKVKKWIDTPQTAQNQRYIIEWHYFILGLQEYAGNTEDAGLLKTLNLYLLRQFFVTPYDTNRDFYDQFEKRMEEARKVLNMDTGSQG